MAYKDVFERHEIKYRITAAQKRELLGVLAEHMKLDRYGRTTIRNLYYDTDAFRIVRHSIERPVYKEKLRVRSYRQVAAGDEVFVELKKKYKSVVYKRRIALPETEAMQWLAGGGEPRTRSQIEREIEYFRQYYQKLHPAVFLSYEREAYYSIDGTDFRLTFDENILARTERLSLSEAVGGTRILPPGSVLMELKTAGGIPIWMTELLTRHQMFRNSFSKYGAAYRQIIWEERGEVRNVG